MEDGRGIGDPETDPVRVSIYVTFMHPQSATTRVVL